MRTWDKRELLRTYASGELMRCCVRYGHDAPAAARKRSVQQRTLSGLTKEAIMLAIVAAVLFAIALILDIAGVGLGPLGPSTVMLAGLLCLALQFAGVGARSYRRSRI